MSKYWGKQIFSLGSFPEAKLVKSKRWRRKERPKVGNNNGQQTPPLVAHAKPPGLISEPYGYDYGHMTI